MLKIEPSLFTVKGLLKVLLFDEHGYDMFGDIWRAYAEIIPNYMPPYPREDTRPSCVVKCGEAFLRHSAGPKQGFFWDIYGDDFIKPELALVALLHAPTPPFFLKRPNDALRDSEGFGSITIKLPDGK